jgi:hypothetical protein
MNRPLLPLGLLLTLVGYFGPWVDHRAAGLVITGLDLGEYVKFLPAVRDGSIHLWRPGFYAPLLLVGLTAALHAYRPGHGNPWPQRILLLALTLVAALNLVPPAWTPARLLEPEFRVQTSTLVGLLIALAGSPLLALLPARLSAALITAAGVAALALPIPAFLAVLPAISDLYAPDGGSSLRAPLSPGWGLWLMAVAISLTIVAAWFTPPRQPIP